ncbi:MAG TPA: NUDIX hydrolase [Rudaea sp.]|nr:NUDIX hydrolase [Rudaea sp.]
MNRTTPAHPQNDPIWRPDVTVACIVPRNGKFLLVEEIVRGERVLNQPAGHLEPDESLPAAAVRETREETGWDVSLTHLVGIYQWANADGAFLRFTFAAEPLRHDPARTLDDGIVRALWMPRDEIAASRNLRSPMVLRGIDDYLDGKRSELASLACLLEMP